MQLLQKLQNIPDFWRATLRAPCSAQIFPKCSFCLSAPKRVDLPSKYYAVSYLRRT